MNYYDMDMIKANIKKLYDRIEKAAMKSGRKPEDIEVIAVTKTIEPERINMALECGIRKIGENRVQELCGKYEKIKYDCEWHLIGHLQNNKVKYIIDKVSMIHSVDSLELMDEIQKRAEKYGRIIDVLVQVNVAGEETKFGIHPSDVTGFLEEASTRANIRVKGLMTIAPLAENPEKIRYVFSDLRKKFIDIKRKNIDNINMIYLSMGMSNDFEIAIEEGSNMIRVGTAIFGKRQA